MTDIGCEILLLNRIAVLSSGCFTFISNTKARALLAFLVLSEGREASRESICGLLWPETDDGRARASLRQTLRRLRRDLGEVGDLLGSQGDRLSVRIPVGSTDKDRLLDRIEVADNPDALPQEVQPVDCYLPGLDGLTSPLDSWLSVQRRLFAEAVTSRLERVLKRHAPTEAAHLAAARALQVLEPGNEHAARAEMLALYRQGNPAGAIAAYERLVETLAEAYDTEPDRETGDLIASIKLGTVPPEAAAHDPALTARPTLVIECDSGACPSEVEAFRTELIDRMVRFREWQILDRRASDPGPDAFLLTLGGVALESGNSVPDLRAVLTRVSTRQLLWTERVGLRPGAWEAGCSRIVQKFAMAINTQMGSVRRRGSAPQLPNEGPVFDRWLRFQDLISRWSPERESEAMALLESIVADDPGFAPAHAEIAGSCNCRHLVYPGTRRSAELDARAMHHAGQAVRLDPLDTRSQRVTAWAHLMQGHYGLAKIHFEQAIDLNVSSPFTLMSCAQGLAFCGENERAADLARAAESIGTAPYGFLEGYLVGIHFLAGRMEACVEAADGSSDTISNLPGWKAAALWELDRHSAARAAADDFLEGLAPVWCGAEPMTRAAVQEWFAEAFPIRDRATHRRLNAALGAALTPESLTGTG